MDAKIRSNRFQGIEWNIDRQYLPQRDQVIFAGKSEMNISSNVKYHNVIEFSIVQKLQTILFQNIPDIPAMAYI